MSYLIEEGCDFIWHVRGEVCGLLDIGVGCVVHFT